MIHRHGWFLLAFFVTGCSTAPIANTFDWICPGKMYPDQKGLAPYGGVGIPQGAILAPPAGVTIGVPLPPGAAPVPPAVPLPGNAPVLQPPLPPAPPPQFGSS